MTDTQRHTFTFLNKGRRRGLYLAVAAVLVLVNACSTTRVIPEDQSRLVFNKVIIENDRKYSGSDISQYIRQKPNSYYLFFRWNPFLCIYNWDTGKNSGWDRFVRKLGQEPVIFDSSLVESSKKNILNHLEHVGYYHSTIRDSIVTKDKKTRVFYKVNLGKQYPIHDYQAAIEDPVMADIFAKKDRHSKVKRGSFLSEKNLEEETQRLTEIYRNNGYYEFNDQYFTFEADTNQVKDSAMLTLYLKNHKRSEDDSEEKEHAQFFINRVKIIPAPNLTEYGIYTDILNRLELDTINHKGLEIIYWNKPSIRPEVLFNMTRLYPGRIYREKDVNATYDRLSNMRIFNTINIELDKVDSNLVDCTVKLTPSKKQGYKVSFEASINSTALFGISPTLAYYNKNLFGGGEWWDIGLMGNFQFKFKQPIKSNEFGVNTSLSLPNFLFLPDRIFGKSQPRTEFSLTYNYQNRPEYTRHMISATFGYTWDVKRKFFYKINPIQVNIVKLDNLSEDFYESLKDPYLQNSYQDHFDLGLGATFYYTNNAALNPKTSRFYVKWQNDIAGNLLSLFNPVMHVNDNNAHMIWGTPYSQYYRTEVSVGQTWVFGKKRNQQLAVRAMAGIGLAYGNSNTIPFEKAFWAGGANSLRGWAAKSIGPGMSQVDTTFAIPNQTGDFRFEANVEYRFPIVWKFAGAVFVDAGNIWNIEKREDLEFDPAQLKASTFFKSIAMSYGIGLRLDLDFVLLRLDLGMVGYDPRKQAWIPPKHWFQKNTYAIQFGVGYPF